MSNLLSGHGTNDESGNVWEWCEDWSVDDYYGSGSHEIPRGPSKDRLSPPFQSD
jgi:formylglycine-generating enzyme required for sulfatase activity